ncbi:MAG: LysE family translocator, partial [Flavobacteriaceae bacterium]
VFFGTVLTTYLTVDFFKILLAKQLKSKLTPTRVTRIKKGIGLLLVASGVFLMVKGFLPQEALPLSQGIKYLE